MKKLKVRNPSSLRNDISWVIYCYKFMKNICIDRPRVPITVTLPDGHKVEATAWETTPFEIARNLSKSLSERIVIAKVLIFFFLLI
jgi:hypothetical protein